MRHTYAVAALCAGDDIKTVQENLGHATAALTLDVYGHITKKMQQDSANRMQKVYENLAKKASKRIAIRENVREKIPPFPKKQRCSIVKSPKTQENSQ